MKHTENYSLNKIDLSDSPPDIRVLNPNFDTIDAELKRLSENVKNSDTEFTKHVEYHIKSYVVSQRERDNSDPNYGII